MLLVLVLGLLLSAWSKIAREIWRPRTRGQAGRWLASKQPRSHLVLFLSNVITDANGKKNAEPDGGPKGTSLTGDLDVDLEHLAGRDGTYWPWEQMLRAIRAHLPVLCDVYCVCSQKSLPQATLFGRIVKSYRSFDGVSLHKVYHCRNGLCVVAASRNIAQEPSEEPAGFNFEDYDQLAPALRQLITDLIGQGVSESSIVVDFTGGQKVASVVAMTQTYDSEVVAQYVQTGGAKDVYCYDIVLEKRRLDVPVK